MYDRIYNILEEFSENSYFSGRAGYGEKVRAV